MVYIICGQNAIDFYSVLNEVVSMIAFNILDRFIFNFGMNRQKLISRKKQENV